MKIAYGKLGRSYTLSLGKSSNVGGDVEVVNLLNHLRQDHEVHLIGPNRCDARLENTVQYWDHGDLFDNLPGVNDHNRFPDDPVYMAFLQRLEEITPKLPKLDAWLIWLGQHGTSCSFLPRIMKERSDTPDPRLKGMTSPLMSLINYVYPLVHVINHLGIKPIWLCPDPRNKLKARDLWDKDQEPVIAQYNTYRDNSFYSPALGLRDNRVHYVYGAIELLAVDRDRLSEESFCEVMRHDRKLLCGMLVNEGYAGLGKNGRLYILQEWMKNVPDWEIFGSWTKNSQYTLARRITTVPVEDVTKTLGRWRSTLTMPATAGGWATAKPWECFAAGTVCFRHPLYDDQDHIYGQHMNSELRDFLSPRSPDQFATRVHALAEDMLWRSIAQRQFHYLMQSVEREQHGTRMIRGRLQDVLDRRDEATVLRRAEEVVPV